MEGPHSDYLFDNQMQLHDLSGILPRTACYILQEVQRLHSYIHDEIKVEISAIEIYLDQVRDLFSDKQIELLTDNKKQVCLKGQTWRSVNKIEDFLNSIKLSASKRVFGSNGLNSHSSRSHHVFQIKIHSTDKLSKPRVSLLNIVDLAGSERRTAQTATQSKSIAPQTTKLSKSMQLSAEELRHKQTPCGCADHPELAHQVPNMLK